MASTWPCTKSFRPLNEHSEAATPDLIGVGVPGAEKRSPIVPGGPVISPAKAGAALRPASAVTQTATASDDLVCIAHLRVVRHLVLAPAPNLEWRRNRVKRRYRG